MNLGVPQSPTDAVHKKTLWPFHQNRTASDANQWLDGLDPVQFAYNPVSPFTSSRQAVGMGECGPNEICGMVEDNGAFRILAAPDLCKLLGNSYQMPEWALASFNLQRSAITFGIVSKSYAKGPVIRRFCGKPFSIGNGGGYRRNLGVTSYHGDEVSFHLRCRFRLRLSDETVERHFEVGCSFLGSFRENQPTKP